MPGKGVSGFFIYAIILCSTFCIFMTHYHMLGTISDRQGRLVYVWSATPVDTERPSHDTYASTNYIGCSLAVGSFESGRHPD